MLEGIINLLILVYVFKGRRATALLIFLYTALFKPKNKAIDLDRHSEGDK